MNEAEPLINRSFCPDKAILAWFSGTFAQCPLSALAGRYDNGNLICLLARAAVNYPYPSMKSECVGLYEKGTVAKKVVFGIGEIVPKTGGILLANLFPRYKAEMSAELFPSLGTFKEVKGEAKF